MYNHNPIKMNQKKLIFNLIVGDTMDIGKGQTLWNEIREELKIKIYFSWIFSWKTFGNVTKVCKVENGYIYVVTSNSYYKHKINNNYYRTIEVICRKIINENVKFKFIINDEIKSDPIINKPLNKSLNVTDLNQNYDFDSFAICDSNGMATYASIKIADQPGYVFNNKILYI